MADKDRQIYKEFIRYGKIVKSEDFDFHDDGVFITMKVIVLDGVRRLFFLRNGLIVHNEII